jgi:hypothetical protein
MPGLNAAIANTIDRSLMKNVFTVVSYIGNGEKTFIHIG